MTLFELRKEDFSFRVYELVKASLAVQDERIVEILRLDNYKTQKSKFVLVKKKNHESKGSFRVSTKSYVIPLEDAVFFTSWIANDSPLAKINYMSDKKETEDNE